MLGFDPIEHASSPATLINVFEVPAGLDDDFVRWWKRTRDFLDAQAGRIPTSLHRAIELNARYRYVNIAEIARPADWRSALEHPDFPGSEMPGRRYPSLYDVTVDDGWRPVDDEDAVIVINPFAVPADDADEFLDEWSATRDRVRDQPGRLGMRLYRSRALSAHFPFVLVAQWETVDAFVLSHRRPEVQEAVAAMRHRGSPAVYQIVSH